MKLAREADLDLVKIAPKAQPPVCKIIDYGKYKYELARKEKEAKKKQKTVEERISPLDKMRFEQKEMSIDDLVYKYFAYLIG